MASTNAGSCSLNRSGPLSPTISTQQETSVVTTITVSTQQQVPITTTVPTQQQVARPLTLNDVSLIVQEVVKYVPQLLGQQPIQIPQPATINRPCEPAVIFPQRPVTIPNPLIYSQYYYYFPQRAASRSYHDIRHK